ncbi:MAG: phenylalanine--tRNA ligase subunit beta [Spirochaetes bacterium]|nr:phenylalanine--tRNA ligase subunit beta [Spirochaetota bacterium]
MPKIDVNEDLLFQALGRRFEEPALVELLTAAKAELDGWDHDAKQLRIELNDTNRPDLWSTLGLARQLGVYIGRPMPSYPFFSRQGDAKPTADRRVVVDAGLADIRPYIVSFVAEGREVTDTLLREIIQSQEKLCGNFGRKRKTIAMGVSRADLIAWPVHYRAADPDATRFTPLDFDRPLSMREILAEHPKGREYGPLVAGYPRFPLLADAKGEVLTFPPVINSALIGGVKPGDRRLFIDLTGPDLEILLTAGAIAACDFADMGFTVLPVRVEFPRDTHYGRKVTTPYYFQAETALEVADAERRLGDRFSPEEAAGFVRKMGSTARIEGSRLVVSPPPFRNDFLHPVDVIEEIMIGRGMASFAPVMPREFTVGRLTRTEEHARRVRDLMVGLGYQEMIYNYLGTRADFADRMLRDGSDLVEIANPMSESYAVVRDSPIPNLLASETASANAAYPHRIFEVGKAVLKDPADNQGCRTVTCLGALLADREMGFNDIDAHVLALCYYLNLEPAVSPVEDPRFIPGRAAAISVGGRKVGVMGEIAPQVLERWGIQMPCAAAEIVLDELMQG